MAADVSPGERLKRYWTRDPEGLAKWARNDHPWRTLYRHLIKYLKDPNRTARVTESFYRAVFGGPSGWRRGKNPTGPG